MEYVIYDSFQDTEGIFWEIDIQPIIKKFFEENDVLVVVSNIGNWNGNQNGGTILEGKNYKELYNYDDIKITQTNNELYFYGYHHDGVDLHSVRIVNYRGQKYIDNHSDKSRKELVEKLFNTKCFSKKADLLSEMRKVGYA